MIQISKLQSIKIVNDEHIIVPSKKVALGPNIVLLNDPFEMLIVGKNPLLYGVKIAVILTEQVEIPKNVVKCLETVAAGQNVPCFASAEYGSRHAAHHTS